MFSYMAQEQPFQGPASAVEVTSVDDKSHPRRANLLIHDAHSRLFGLHVQTVDAYNNALLEEVMSGAPAPRNPEPVLVVPVDRLDLTRLAASVRTMSDEFLNVYLTPQD